MKGMDLPINVIVVVLVAVLVLTVVTIFLMQGTNPDSVALQDAFGRGCTTLRNINGCGTQDFEVAGYTIPGQTGNAMFFAGICSRLGYTQEQCLIACGCQ